MDIVSKEEFKKRKKTNHSYMTFSDTHETNQSFECGCGEDHFIGRDGVKLAKQVKTNEMETGFQETKLMVLKRVIEKKDKTMRVKSTVDY